MAAKKKEGPFTSHDRYEIINHQLAVAIDGDVDRYEDDSGTSLVEPRDTSPGKVAKKCSLAYLVGLRDRAEKVPYNFREEHREFYRRLDILNAAISIKRLANIA